MKKKNIVCDVALECLDLCNIRAVAPNNSMYFHSVNQWYWGVCIFAVRTVAPNDSSTSILSINILAKKICFINKKTPRLFFWQSKHILSNISLQRDILGIHWFSNKSYGNIRYSQIGNSWNRTRHHYKGKCCHRDRDKHIQVQ